MKKIIGIILIILLLSGILIASAATLIPSTLTRNIKLTKSGSNPAIPGESSVTGLPNTNDSYIPILSQIDNNLGALPQWGISHADIMYELPIAGGGLTRLTALFSDSYPEEAGPVRSGRVMHADLREEWDAALVFYGRQEVPGSNMREILSKYGATAKGLAIDGHANVYKDFMPRVRYHLAPHNVSAHIKEIRDMLATTLNYSFPLRPFKFTDDKNYGGMPALQFSVIHNENKDTSSTFIYDAQANGFERFTILGSYSDYLNPFDSLIYSNVIIQRTRLTFNNSSVNPLLPDVVGSGAADIFVAGQYIAGAWSRDKLSERTVFYDQNGSELALQRGKTWIIIASEKTNIAIGDIDSSMQDVLFSDIENDNNDELIVAEGKTTTTVTQTTATGSSSSEDSMDDSVSTSDEVSNDHQTDMMNFAIINVPNKGPLNMREKDTGKSKILTKIPNGTSVEVIQLGEEWTKIVFNGKTGYVMTSYLSFIK